jgi:hypothetical protein
MSAFVVNPSVIDKVVGYMYDGQHSERQKDWGRYLQDQLTEFGKALYAMNVNAVNQRYEENNEPPEYEYRQRNCNRHETLKAMHCLRYQCTEGNVPDCALYAELTNAIHSLADDIACDSPEWDAAPWDGEPAKAVPQKQILITMDGGVIQDINDIPPGVQVVVRDYDIEDVDSAELTADENGDEYIESVYNESPAGSVKC